VAGGAGSGKTTMSLQFLINGAKEFDESGVYVSFNETPTVLNQYMGHYGWDLKELEDKGKLNILRLDPADVMQVIREDYGQIRDTIKSTGAQRFVLDPLSTFNIIVKDPFDRKMSLLKFCEWLRKNECTSMLTLEAERAPNTIEGLGFEEYVVDGVIILYNLQLKNIRQSAVEILKMRGCKHSRKIVPFIFKKGLNISHEEKLFWSTDK
jgi:KaiC/GvpD/RAD55 family RecA-like ATPase